MAFFVAGQEVYGVCPCCSEIFRVSEMQISYGKELPEDRLTRLREGEKRLEDDKKVFEQDEKGSLRRQSRMSNITHVIEGELKKPD